MYSDQEPMAIRTIAPFPPPPQAVTEEEVIRLVESFYSKVRNDEELAPVFEAYLADWDQHIAKMIDFWSSALRGTGRYKGTPMPKHAALHGLTAQLFHRWLALFWKTTAESGNAVLQQRADDLARRMAGGLWHGYQMARAEAADTASGS
ncbi:group III truncated hemoglobin [Variovorax sp. Sphag1AA]|uniref:group III truncated hemoglobin n=1 Tax=Variovorax sp. Sphag1AA TaxID=2587027 RepID=UPI0018170E7F|nr:hemoglobin [Variovorax sp. Sphag1AA]